MEVSTFVATVFTSLVGGSVGALVTYFLTTRFQERNKFRLAVLDKRLIAHQEAFTLCHKLYFSVEDRKLHAQAVDDCQVWWAKNCLYLPAQVRNDFHDAFIRAFPHGLQPVEVCQKQDDDIKALLRLIEHSVDEHVSDIELKRPTKNEDV